MAVIDCVPVPRPDEDLEVTGKMMPMKLSILMFSSYFPPEYSGAAKQAISLARQLRERGHHVEFVTVKRSGLADADSHDGFPVHRIEAGRGRRHKELRLWWNFMLYALKRKNEFDVIHSHGAYYVNSIVGPLARLVGWKSLAKASLADNDLHGVGLSLTGTVHRRFLRLVDACIAISRDLEKEFLAAGIARKQIHYLPNGVDTKRFCPARPGEKAALRAELGLPLDRPVVLTAGVFDQRKNIGWLMDAWARERAFGTGALLLAVGPRSREDGDGSFLASLASLADSNRDLLRLAGEVDDLERYYRAADLFVLPSHSEGMPNVVLEAMASGLPCVATRVSGIGELVTDGSTGYTFAPGDSSGLGSAVRNALADSAGLLGTAARACIEAQFALADIVVRYESLYARLIDRAQPHLRAESTHA